MARQLYLVAYDVCCPRRLGAVWRAVRALRVQGQKSVAECWATPAEREALCADLLSILDQQEDRLHILRLDPRMKPRLFGVAQHFQDRPFIFG